MPSIIARIFMSFKNYKRFEQFDCLGPPRFGSVVGKDAYEFLMNIHKKFYNLSSPELLGVMYTTYQLRDTTKY